MDFIELEDDYREMEYEKLTIGDIIWAKRYNNELSMLQIPEGHREGPYIIIGRHGKRLKCLYGTSLPSKDEILDYKFLKIIDENYSLIKTTYINIAKNCYMAKSRFIKKMGHLNIEDGKSLLKKIEITQREGMQVEMEIDVPKIPLEPGDIIKKNYIILDIDDKYYYCVKMHAGNSNFLDFNITVNGNDYFLDFFSIKKINKEASLIRENFIDEITLKKILCVFKYKIEQLNRRFEICRGSLIRINGIKYYVYGEIGNEWMIFPLIGQKKNNLCHIIIDSKSFYTNFKDCIQISKKQTGIEIIGIATEKEMQEIKKNKKSYQKSSKNDDFESICQNQKKEIQSGTIIGYRDNDIYEMYIVILKTEEELIVMKYNDFLKGQYVLAKLFTNKVEWLGHIDNFNLKQVLLDIQDIAAGYINKKRLKKLINSF